MKRRPFIVLARTGVLAAALLSLNGCLLDEELQPSRGSLSQVMKASASGGGQASGHSGSSSGAYFDVGAESSGDSSGSGGGGGGGGPMVDYGNHEFSWQIPLEVGYEVPLNGQIRSLTRYCFAPVAVEDDHNFATLYFAGDVVELQPDSLPAAAVDDTWMWEIGVSYRYYFTPAHAFFSPYFSASAGFQQLVWNYRSPVVVGTDVITQDGLGGVNGYAGLGIAIKRNSYLSFFAEAGFGGTVFVDKTDQGFNNDVFSNYGYFTVRAGLSIKF